MRTVGWSLRRGVVSLPLLVVTAIFPVWIRQGLKEQRRQDEAAQLLYEEDLGQVSHFRQDQGLSRGKEPLLDIDAVDGRWLWPVPWWDAWRWLPRRPCPEGALNNPDVVAEYLAYLRSGPTVSLTLDADRLLTDVEWEYVCREFPAVSFLDIFCPVKDEQLRFLKRLRYLNVVWIAGKRGDGPDQPFTGEGFVHLRSMPRLHAVILQEVHLSPKGKEALGRLTQVRRLEDDLADDETLAHLGGMTSLEGLYVRDQAKLSGEGLAHLRELPRLRYLDLSFYRDQLRQKPHVGDEDLRRLGPLPELRSLRLENTLVTDDGLCYLTAIPHLEDLYLSHTAVGDDGLRNLAGTKLRNLEMRGVCISNAGIAYLSQIPSLESLTFDPILLTDSAALLLATQKNLQSVNNGRWPGTINLTGSQVTAAACKEWANSLPPGIVHRVCSGSSECFDRFTPRPKETDDER
jgi:hypothetical protein